MRKVELHLLPDGTAEIYLGGGPEGLDKLERITFFNVDKVAMITYKKEDQWQLQSRVDEGNMLVIDNTQREEIMKVFPAGVGLTLAEYAQLLKA